MNNAATQLPTARDDLVIRPIAENGRYVVKDPARRDYFEIGRQERFLLAQLDGQRTADEICRAFELEFGELLSAHDLGEFVEIARAQGLLVTDGESGKLRDKERISGDSPPLALSLSPAPAPAPRPRQSILYWRKNIYDPDRLFTWLAPRLWFFWTRAFLALSAACIALAVLVVCASHHELAASFADALRWESVVWAWLMLLVVTALHESAHGLTCKHYGGEVHEIGFLLMFFVPCFYCNVSDAWLFKEKSKRLWVTFAGGYFELFLWSLAVLVWRLAVPGSLPHYLAFLVLTECGIQTLFNFNPLLKLDGYYLLSDWLEMPNLEQRALLRFKQGLRSLLWGAPLPERRACGKLLFRFGLATWLYSLVFLALMLWWFLWFLWPSWGWLGVGGIGLLALLSGRGLLRGCAAGEVRKMITKRHKRSAIWLLALGGLAAAFGLLKIEDRASGTFHVRALTRAELRAPLAAFLKEIYFDEGGRVSPGTLVVRLEVPDLNTRLAQKRAEVREAQARLRLLEIGPRPEEVAEQRERVERAKKWRDLAQQDLTKTRQALEAELTRLEKQIAACRAELDVAQESYQRVSSLAGQGVLTDEQYRDAQAKSRVNQARLAEAEAAQRACRVKGSMEAEAELARREKDLADAHARLKLLEAGTRPEEVEAERARLARLQEEASHLQQLQHKLSILSPVCGVVTTPRVKEKIGQYVKEGELICTVEEPASLEAEITLSEQDVARVRPGHSVALKARAMPFNTLQASVDRLAPAAVPGDVQSTLLVYCRPECKGEVLHSGMSGYARIYTGKRSLGEISLHRALRFLRTEFWW